MVNQAWYNKLFSILEAYMDCLIDHNPDSKERDPKAMYPSMWLSVVNICVQNQRDELAEKARKRFEASYDWRNELNTDMRQPGQGGRKVKR